jgi:hypothetical protein
VPRSQSTTTTARELRNNRSDRGNDLPANTDPGAHLTNPLAVLAPAVLILVTACSTPHQSPNTLASESGGALFDTISALDAEAFSAFNTCATPGQLQKHGTYFSADVEFYHDTGGVTWSRKEMLANTEKYVCGNFRRELVPGSLRVYPINGFGAITQGVHKFCQFKSGTCEGAAEFVIVWRNDGGKWSITRVLSYGHRPT